MFLLQASTGVVSQGRSIDFSLLVHLTQVLVRVQGDRAGIRLPIELTGAHTHLADFSLLLYGRIRLKVDGLFLFILILRDLYFKLAHFEHGC